MQLLIVDDDRFSADVAAEALTRAGYEFIQAGNGTDALRILNEHPCRLVVSDWLMPEMDGLELCREIRRRDFGGYVYIILLTSRDAKQDIIEGFDAGADDFITKPFHPDELRARVRTGERVLALETREVAILAMAKLAESRDPETGMHLERMRSYARVLTQQLADTQSFGQIVNDEYVRLIYLTSPLHDIGKVGIPDCVLLKPGRLSDREFEIMKRHTTIGADTLDAAARQYPAVRYLQMARDIALTHHERFDGSGYPRGLAGEDIPLCGRIVALADVYDALTSKRVYKAAFAHDVARSIILDESGKHFDPHVIDAFIQQEQRFVEIRESFSEDEKLVLA